LFPGSTSLVAGTCNSLPRCSQYPRCSFISPLRILFLRGVSTSQKCSSRRTIKFQVSSAPGVAVRQDRRDLVGITIGVLTPPVLRAPGNPLAQRAERHSASGGHRQRTENRKGRLADIRPDCRVCLRFRQARGSRRVPSHWQNHSAGGVSESRARTRGPRR
jgi:hypothetical protein